MLLNRSKANEEWEIYQHPGFADRGKLIIKSIVLSSNIEGKVNKNFFQNKKVHNQSKSIYGKALSQFFCF